MKWKQILKYHARWQSGFIFSWPTFYVCQDLLNMPLWTSIITFQFVGAIIYYKIDHSIFNK